MTAQDTLFDFDGDFQSAPSTSAPRCPMCPRPLRWSVKLQDWTRYCGGGQCTNRIRLCKTCGREFNRDAKDAGTKYCSLACMSVRSRALAPRATCIRCGEPGQRPRGKTFHLCVTCAAPIALVLGRLRAHHVSVSRVLRLIADPHCEICRVNIVVPTHKGATMASRRPSPLLVVDHDHECCPAGQSSCGACVRGLICGACNTALGFMGDNATIARSAAKYLERVFLQAAAPS